MSIKVRIAKPKKNRKLWTVVVELRDKAGKRMGHGYYQGSFKTKTEALRRKKEVEEDIKRRLDEVGGR